jgi:two-component system, LytTR family, response regulator
MSGLRALIVDDEPLARRAMRQHLAAVPDLEVAGECGHAADALIAVRRERPDLLFVDIEMPDMDGFTLIRELGSDVPPAVVFVTAYDEHALRAFRVHALDYLLKPVDPLLLDEAVRRARTQLERGTSALASTPMREPAQGESRQAAAHYARRILIPQDGRSTFLDVDLIDRIEAVGNRVRIHVGEGTHVLRSTLAALEALLDPGEFVRIHRSTIVNLDRVRWIEPYGGYDYQVILTGGLALRVGRGYRERLLRLVH